MRFAVLLTVHNRRETTLRCLERLFAQKLPAETAFTVFLVDDSCTDGTAEAVRAGFPLVRIIPGNGNLYWNQGMRLAWKTAADAAEWDAYLWLNDDTMLLEGALRTMLETLKIQERETGKQGIVVGSCREPEDGSQKSEVRSQRTEDGGQSAGDENLEKEGGQRPLSAVQRSHVSDHRPPLTSKLTYGGQRNGCNLPPTDQPRSIDRFNGNLVLVSRAAFLALGNLCAVYRHSFGDIDYGIRAARERVPVWLAPGFLGECPRNPPLRWMDPKTPLMERIRVFHGPKGCTWKELRAFALVRGQRLWLLSVFRQYATVIFPAMGPKKI